MHVQALSKNAFSSKHPPTAFFSLRHESRLTTSHELSMRQDKSQRLQRVCSLYTAMSKSSAAACKNFSKEKNRFIEWEFFFSLKQKFQSEQRSSYVAMTRCCVRYGQTASKSRFCQVRFFK